MVSLAAWRGVRAGDEQQPGPPFCLRESREHVRSTYGCRGRSELGEFPFVMYARAVDEASARLRELRQEEWDDLGLAALALALAVAATQVHAALAVPLFLGALAVGAFGMRALWRRWDLLERLAGERDAYVISEVLAFASREATMERRHSFAALIRGRLRAPIEGRVIAAAEEFEALASELDDDELALDPAGAVACMRLLSDLAESPLLNSALPPEDLRARVRQIRSRFRPRRLTACPRRLEGGEWR